MRTSHLRLALLLVGASMAGPGAAQFPTPPARPGERAMPIADALPAIRACGNPAVSQADDLPADSVGLIAFGLQHPGWYPANCTRRDPEAALALLEAYAGDPVRRDSGSLALWRLFELYGERPDERSRRRRDDILRLLWLRGEHDPSADFPLLTRAEQERLLRDGANIAFLRDWVGRHRPHTAPRRRLAEALLLDGSPHFDPAEAAAVFPEDGPRGLRLRLLRALLAEERNFAAALDQLPHLRIDPNSLGGEDWLVVEAIVARASLLFGRSGEPDRTTGARILAALAESDVRQARNALRSALDSAGCCLVLSQFPAEARVRPLMMMDDDYPASAIRGRTSGVVELEAYFGPDGKLLFVDAGPGDPSVLRRSTIAAWRRRALRNVELTGHRGRYVRVAGPTVHYRLHCVDGEAEPPPRPAAAADEGVLTLYGRCLRPVTY